MTILHNWKFDDRKKVVYSDESKFNLFKNDGEQYVRKFEKKYTLPTIKHDGGSVVIWRCFSSYSMYGICILKNYLVPYTLYVLINFNKIVIPNLLLKLLKTGLEEKIRVKSWPS